MSLIQSHALATAPVPAGTLAAIYKRHGYTVAQAYVLIFGRAPRISN
jgi:hypothetical protein